MQLLYVWIEDYKNIKKQGFNFSSEFIFDYDDKNGVLTIKDNPNYIENFFGDNISNVMAIVGKNGSGKSTLLNFLIENILFDIKMGDIAPKITIGKLNNKIGIFIYYHAHILENDKCEIIIKSTKITTNDIEENNNGRFNYKGFNQINIADFDATPTVFYSPNFEDSISIYYENNMTSIIDVSTNYWLKKNLKEDESFLESYQFFQVRRILHFFNNAPQELKNKIPFKLPDYISIIIEPTIYVIPEWTENIEKEEKSLLNNYREKRDTQKLNDSIRIKFAEEELQLYIAKVFINYLHESNDIVSFNDCEGNNVWEKLIYYTNSSKIRNSGNLKEYIPYLYNYLKKYHRDYTKGIQSSYTFAISIKDAINFIENNKKIIGFTFSFFKFNWYDANISTGEKAFINLLSRFFDAAYADNYIKNEIGGRIKEYFEKATLSYNIQEKIYDIIILIDEGETGFHPEWQRKYLHLLIETLPEIFKNIKIQIILTSHSPFVISDLPKDNVIFLDRDKEGNCIVSDMEKHKQTFGANIHTLLSDGFFMEGGLMGEFAKGKIQEVIDKLKECENNTESLLFYKEQKYQIKQIIDMIGEPLIKEHLLQRYNRLFLSEKESLEQQLKFIQDKLKKYDSNQ